MRRTLQMMLLLAGVMFWANCRLDARTADGSKCWKSDRSSVWLSSGVHLGNSAVPKGPERLGGLTAPAPVAMAEGYPVELPLIFLALALWMGWRKLGGYRTLSRSF